MSNERRIVPFCELYGVGTGAPLPLLRVLENVEPTGEQVERFDELKALIYLHHWFLCLEFPSGKKLMHDPTSGAMVSESGALGDITSAVGSMESAVLVVRVACAPETETALLATEAAKKKKPRLRSGAQSSRAESLYWLVFDLWARDLPVPAVWCGDAELAIRIPNDSMRRSGVGEAKLELERYVTGGGASVLGDAKAREAVLAATDWCDMVGSGFLADLFGRGEAGRLYLARYQSSYVGFALVLDRGPEEAELGALCVRRGVPVSHVGKRLVERIIEGVREGQRRRLFLASLPGAIGFYLRMGFGLSRVERREMPVEVKEGRSLSGQARLRWLQGHRLTPYELAVSSYLGRSIAEPLEEASTFSLGGRSITRPKWLTEARAPEALAFWNENADYKRRDPSGFLAELHALNPLEGLLGRSEFFCDDGVHEAMVGVNQYEDAHAKMEMDVGAGESEGWCVVM